MSAMEESNVLSYLRSSAERTPDRDALIMNGGRSRIPFRRLWERAGRVSAGLVREGLQPGDRVILMIPMSIDLYAALLGILKMGAVAVFVDPWIGARQIAAFAAFAEPSGYVGVFKAHLLRLMERRLRSIPVTVTSGKRLLGLPAGRTLQELEAGAGDGAIHPVRPDDPGLITFTTGSSGVPKGVNRTHGFLIAQHRTLKAEFPARDDDVDLSMFPIFALNNLGLGITTVVPSIDFRDVGAVDPAVLLAEIDGNGVTTATASPPLFDRIAEHIESGKAGPPGWRRIVTGGAPVSDEQLERWIAAFPGTEIVVAYGSTEAEPVAHIGARERLEAAGDLRPLAPGFCVGPPGERVRAKVVRIHRGPVVLEEGGWSDWELDTGEIGELVVTGAHVCRDYYHSPEAVAENKIVDGDATVWHRMGDTGYLDREGRFWLAGRVHSTIWRKGEPVHAQLVEQAARGSDSRIRRVAAVGVPDPDLGEKVVVVFEAETGGLEDEVSGRIATAGMEADEVRSWKDSLPVDPRHGSKIDYSRLREMLR